MLAASVYGNTDAGLVRTNNEDAFITQAIWDNTHWLLVVIDGLGGYEGGEVAAKIAKNSILNYVLDKQEDDTLDVIMQAVVEANNAIYRQRNDSYKDMGCVITAAILDLEKKQLNVAHVGDTRLYQYDNNELVKLTHDHSFVGGLEDGGHISESEAMNHPRRNLIDRIVGDELKDTETPRFIEAAIFPISSGYQYLFCSDGLSDMLTSADITSVLQKSLNVKKKVNQLIDYANKKGGKDNITTVVVCIRSEQNFSPIKQKKTEKNKVQRVKNKKKRLKEKMSKQGNSPLVKANTSFPKKNFSIVASITIFLLAISLIGLLICHFL